MSIMGPLTLMTLIEKNSEIESLGIKMERNLTGQKLRHSLENIF